MAHPEFWRGLMNWATELSETASLRWNKAHTAVELRDVSYEMRQNLESLTARAGQIHLLADVYVYFRGQAIEAITNGERPRFFHPVTYRRAAYRGSMEMTSRSMDGYIQPLRDALLEYAHEREATEDPGKPSKTRGKLAYVSDPANRSNAKKETSPEAGVELLDDPLVRLGTEAPEAASIRPRRSRGAPRKKATEKIYRTWVENDRPGWGILARHVYREEYTRADASQRKKLRDQCRLVVKRAMNRDEIDNN